jgi:hypothetical protein
MWDRMNDPRTYQTWQRKPDGSVDTYKKSRRPNGQRRKKRERAGQPVPETEAKKAALSWRLYDAWIRH